MMFIRQLQNELSKLFGKKRTYIGFGAFLVTQSLIMVLFRYTNWHKQVERLLAGNGYLAQDYITALTVAFIMLIPQVMFLMPLYAALVGGDLVAKEAEDGTLRMILARPISRFRLLLVKFLAGIVFATVLVLALGATALLVARIMFPWGGMFAVPLFPENIFSVLTASQGLQLYIGAHLLMAVNASVIVALAFMFSCFNMKPAAATVLALTLLFVNLVMEFIPFFEDYHHFFLVYHFRAWQLIFADPIPWARVLSSLCILVAVQITAFLIGVAGFQARDIKS